MYVYERRERGESRENMIIRLLIYLSCVALCCVALCCAALCCAALCCVVLYCVALRCVECIVPCLGCITKRRRLAGGSMLQML